MIHNGIKRRRNHTWARLYLSRHLDGLVAWPHSWTDTHNNTAKWRSSRIFPRHIRNIHRLLVLENHLLCHSPNVQPTYPSALGISPTASYTSKLRNKHDGILEAGRDVMDMAEACFEDTPQTHLATAYYGDSHIQWIYGRWYFLFKSRYIKRR
jgi:hypothetical protein